MLIPFFLFLTETPDKFRHKSVQAIWHTGQTIKNTPP